MLVDKDRLRGEGQTQAKMLGTKTGREERDKDRQRGERQSQADMGGTKTGR